MQPGRVRVDQGDVDAVFARAERVVESTYYTPYLPRARMEPGNATVLVTDDRVDIWIGDQSPQETRFSAAQITGIPEENVYIHLCHLGGGFGRNGNGPQAEQALMIANANRGTPIHLLVDARGRLHRHDLSRDGHGASQSRARRRRLAARARSAHEHAAGRLRPRRVVRRRVALSRAELPLLESHHEFPRARRHAPRRRPSRARVLSRELHRRARARGGQGPLSLSARAHRAHGAAVQSRHAQGARHGRRDVGLGHAAAARARRARSRSRSAAPRPATRRRSVRWCTRSP